MRTQLGGRDHATNAVPALTDLLLCDRQPDASRDQDSRPTSAAVVVVPGVYYSEGGRCTFPWLIVERCHWCSRPHRHIVKHQATTYRRSPSCAPWRTYTVHIVAIVPHVNNAQAGGGA
jgi:hypothetical protein